MLSENRRSKRIMALMPEEEPAIVQADTKLYSAKLVNLSAGGALMSILDCGMSEAPGTSCQLFFSGVGRMFEVAGEVARVSGRYAAFRFPNLNGDETDQISNKLERMEALTDALCPELS